MSTTTVLPVTDRVPHLGRRLGMAVVGLQGAGKSHLAVLAANETVSQGGRVAWIRPTAFRGLLEDGIAGAALQLHTAGADAIVPMLADLHADLVVVDSVHQIGVRSHEAAALADRLSQQLDCRVIVTVSPTEAEGPRG